MLRLVSATYISLLTICLLTETVSRESTESVESFINLESEISSTQKDTKIRIAKAWTALNNMDTMWKSVLSDNLKRSFFHATVESVLMYGASAWSLTKSLESKLDRTYNGILRAILNIFWRQHPTKLQLRGPIPDISTIFRERRMRFAGHCWRAKQELASELLLWSPDHGKRRVGCPTITYINQPCRDTGCLPNALPALLKDRDGWNNRLMNARASST